MTWAEIIAQLDAVMDAMQANQRAQAELPSEIANAINYRMIALPRVFRVAERELKKNEVRHG